MLHIQTTTKDVHTLVLDLTAAVERHKFGVLHVHDLQTTMRNKGIDFPETCRILEICNPGFANTVLSGDMQVSLALPCRITVYTEKGQTKVGTLLPTALMGVFGDDHDKDFLEAVMQVEKEILGMIEEALADDHPDGQ